MRGFDLARRAAASAASGATEAAPGRPLGATTPQFDAVAGMLRDPSTLSQMERVVNDPGAIAMARQLQAQVQNDPAALSMLAEHEQRIRADPHLSSMMAHMQKLFVPQGMMPIPRAPGPRALGTNRDEL